MGPPKTKYESEVVRLADLTVVMPTFTGFSFVDCLLLGPAVLMVSGRTTMDGCGFTADISDLFFEVPESRTFVVGPMRAQDCTFIDCVFQGVGLAGPPALREMIQGAFGVRE